jgi:DNA-binding CsgD family transcriptional regulator
MVMEQLERDELQRLMELASQCLTVTTLKQLEAIISSIHDLVTFDKAALCALSKTDTEVALTHYVNHSYGTQWAELYASQNFHRVDPVLLHARTTEGAFRWDETTLARASEHSAAFLDAAAAFGLADGVSFSCTGISPAFRSVLSFTGGPVVEFERARRVLTVIGPHLHESYRRVLDIRLDHWTGAELSGRAPAERRPAELPARNPVELATREPAGLSVREREVLCWAQQGKTYWEIGCILGISQRTVKFHFARIKAKLDVVSTAHAIAKAMRTGLIT